eukprot:TRINITY_DN57288_c0_g1_i1.p1 TRINITY_DN57288_c0_g1~~TRINITY_DN57288_c0_g1_i1.p1  ORF type:complete len:311 (+),score=73.41 TRINITY_DN57288_c0_g1_i1:81-1013(+)
MPQAKVWLVNGDSLGSFDLDPQEPFSTLRAQLEKQLNVSNFHEVKLLRHGQEAKELKDCEDVLEDLEVLALQAVSLTKVADAMEAEAIAAKQAPRPVDLEMVDAITEALAPLDDLQAGEEGQRMLKAAFELARRHRVASDDAVYERLGVIYGRLCSDASPCVERLNGPLRSYILFAVPALARMAQRPKCSLDAHARTISARLVQLLTSEVFDVFKDASEACFADVAELLARLGTDAALAILEAKLPERRRSEDPYNSTRRAPQLELILLRIRERQALLRIEATKSSNETPFNNQDQDQDLKAPSRQCVLS